MLDAYIIERIKRERAEHDRQEGSLIPLRIERDQPRPDDRHREPEPKKDERGSIIVDFQV